jgi:hypothetical protein
LYAKVSFNLQDAKGNDVALSTYKGKVLLIVNVASKWYSSSALFFFVLLLIFFYPTNSYEPNPYITQIQLKLVDLYLIFFLRIFPSYEKHPQHLFLHCRLFVLAVA